MISIIDPFFLLILLILYGSAERLFEKLGVLHELFEQAHGAGIIVPVADALIDREAETNDRAHGIAAVSCHSGARCFLPMTQKKEFVPQLFRWW